MMLTPGLRKCALTAHIVTSVGWIGAVSAYLALGVSAALGDDAQNVGAAWIAMEVTIRFVIVPLALAALLTGLVVSLGTPWGLFRYYWTLITLVLTLLATGVLLLHLPTVRALAAIAREPNGTDLGGDFVHAGGGLLLLLTIAALNVYKPQGLTPYGWRKQHARRARSSNSDAA